MGRLVVQNSKEFALWDKFSYWTVNLSSAFLLSASHNVLYFVLDIRTPVIHFLHNFNTFILLLICQLLKNPKGIGRSSVSEKLDQKNTGKGSIPKCMAILLPPALLQLMVTFLSSRIHSQNQSGSLYLLRLFDFLTTIVALKLAPKFLGVGTKNRPSWSLMFPIAIGASLSWLELTHIEYDGFSLALSPVLSLIQGLQLIVLKNSLRHFSSSISFEKFAFYYSGLVSALLSIPALISYSLTVVNYDAAWESIDYLLMSMSMVFMAVFKYSELWLIAHLALKDYCVLEHSKYFLASCGQWFLQNMAHATIYAACGKAIFVVSIFRYFSLRDQKKLNEL